MSDVRGRAPSRQYVDDPVQVSPRKGALGGYRPSLPCVELDCERPQAEGSRYCEHHPSVTTAQRATPTRAVQTRRAQSQRR